MFSRKSARNTATPEKNKKERVNSRRQNNQINLELSSFTSHERRDFYLSPGNVIRELGRDLKGY